jgi:glutamate synthase (ferredoxin)
LPHRQGLYDPAFERDACGVGFVVNIKGKRSHTIVRHAMQVLVNLNHRGACGCEANTGDGAGINMQMPDKFLRKAAAAAGCQLPPPGEYGVGMVFLPKDETLRSAFEAEFEQIVREEVRFCSVGAPYRPTTARSAPRRLQASPLCVRSSSGATPAR